MNKNYDVIIVGGSYAGLSAAMALGRALRNVLIIDNGKPCNRYTPYSHNFITHDGATPSAITSLAKEQVLAYETVHFLEAKATSATKNNEGFTVYTDNGQAFSANKLLFATGVKDIMPPIEGFEACWGKSVLHCPYCHGYEVHHTPTAIILNGEMAYEFSKVISNWTNDLTVLTNGPSTISEEQQEKMIAHGLKINDQEIKKFVHTNGQIEQVLFKDGSSLAVNAIYARPAMEQHSSIPASLGCTLVDGLITVNEFQQTTVKGVYAAGDNTTMFRTVSFAVAGGTKAGAMMNKELIDDRY